MSHSLRSLPVSDPRLLTRRALLPLGVVFGASVFTYKLNEFLTGGSSVTRPFATANAALSQADPGRLHRLQGIGPTNALSELWRYQGPIGYDGSLDGPLIPLSNGGLLFTEYGLVNAIHVVDRATGATRWSKATGFAQPPTYAGGVIFTPMDRRFVVALDEDTGDELWRHEAPHPLINDTLIVVDGRVYFITEMDPNIGGNITVGLNTSLRNLYALDATNGALMWGPAGAMYANTGPLVANQGMLFYAATDGRGTAAVLAHDAATGELRWENNLQASFGAFSQVEILATGDLVILPYRRNHHTTFIAYAAADGGERWRFAFTGEGLRDNYAGADGVLYISGEDNRAVAVDLHTGTELQQFAHPEHDFSWIRAAADNVVYANMEGLLYGFTRHSEQPSLLYTFNQTEMSFYVSALCTADGHLFAVTSDGGVNHAVVALAGSESPSTPSAL